MIRQTDLKIRVVIILALVVLSFFYAHPLKDKLKLGLDLKGGMYLVLKAETSKIPREGTSKRGLFNEQDLEMLLKQGLVVLDEKKNTVTWITTS